MNKAVIVKINKNTPREKIIGLLYKKEKLFVKNVYALKHLFRKLDAWGIDANFFTRFLLPNDYSVKIIDKENNEIYILTAKEIKEYGRYLRFKNDNLSDKAQIFIPRDKWRKPERQSPIDRIKELSRLGVFG